MRATPIGLIARILLVVAPAAGPELGGQQAAGTRYERAAFAGGCFWCMEPPFDELPGTPDARDPDRTDCLPRCDRRWPTDTAAF